MQSELISIIIPCYGVENYIEDCLQSIDSQNFPRNMFEVIIIDDGSTDNTYDVICGFIAGKSNFKVYRKENGGLSSTRNYGLARASGKYVWFVDSDDEINENSLTKILTHLENDVDVIHFGLEKISDKGSKLHEQYLPLVNSGSGKDVFFKQLHEKTTMTMSQLFIAKRKLLLDKELFFVEGIAHEDMLHTPKLLLAARLVITVSEVFYRYRIREGSIMTSLGPEQLLKKSNDLMFIYNDLRQLRDEKNLGKELGWYIYHIYRASQKNAMDAADRELSVNLKKTFYKNKVYLDNKDRLKLIYFTILSVFR